MPGSGLQFRQTSTAVVLLLLGLLGSPVQAASLLFGNTTHGWMEIMAWKPRAVLFHGFLSDAECDHIIKLASPSLARSSVVGQDGGSVLDDIRTSSGTFLLKGSDPILTDVEERVATATALPVSHQEDLQVLKYEHGQKYSAHWDINDSPERMEQMRKKGVLGGLRTATLLMYLTDVEEGGETSFPNGRWIDAAAQAQPPYSECAAKGVAVKPRKGDAILFYSLKPDGQRKDPYSLHAGCPVIRGTKYSATKWIHVEPFGHTDPAAAAAAAPGGCADERPECEAWAASGECTKNAAFMRTQCRLSCKLCRKCQPGDVLCERENARTAGAAQ